MIPAVLIALSVAAFAVVASVYRAEMARFR